MSADMRSAWSHDLPKDAVANVLSAVESFRAEPGQLALLGPSVTTLAVTEALDRGRVLLIRPGRDAAGVTNLLLAAVTETLLARAESSGFRTPARIFVDEAQ